MLHTSFLGAVSYTNAHFGQGTGPIQIDNVGCDGPESVLVQCYHLTIDDCVHAEDAGVRCGPPGNMIKNVLMSIYCRISNILIITVVFQTNAQKVT